MTRICEEEIRPAQLMRDKERCVDADRQFLLDRRNRWVTVLCPACSCAASQPYGSKHGFAYVECLECRTIYTNPRPSLELLHEFYSQSQNYAYWNEHIFPATEETRRERIFRPRAERLAKHCRRFDLQRGTLLEVGAAFGTFCQEIGRLQVFDRIIALEPTPGLAETCRRRGIEVEQRFIEDVEEAGFADVIAAFEVVEHLFSPADFLDHCHRILRPGGLVVLSCPNGRGFDVAALETLSNTFDHEHVNYFHPQSLATLVERCRLEVVDVETPGQLDAELLRKRVLNGAVELSGQPFLKEVLVDRWEDLREPFQQFLAQNKLSSHMWVVARKPVAST